MKCNNYCFLQSFNNKDKYGIQHPQVPPCWTHLVLSQHRHLFLKGDVLLLQLAVVLQQTSFPHLVLSDVIPQLTSLQLCQLGILKV